MSVSISIQRAVKRYGNHTVLENLNLDIRGGEFFTLLGPSGCGKTTLLRMIAGFNSIEGGDFYFNSTRINDLNPAKRNIGMVFQNYAIFPHMTVRRNVEFGLLLRECGAGKGAGAEHPDLRGSDEPRPAGTHRAERSQQLLRRVEQPVQHLRRLWL